MSRLLRAGAIAAVLAAVLAVATSTPASAHTVSGVTPTDYRSVIVSVFPAQPGLRVRLLDLGRRVRLTVDGPLVVVVLGYQGEPYLRIGAGGVEENVRSPAVYENKPRPPGVPAPPLPPIADPAAPPQWHRVHGGRSATWRDSRTRFEGRRPFVAGAVPGRAVAIADWVIPLRVGATPVEIDGRIVWVPGPAAWPWVVAAVVLALGVAAAGRTRIARPALIGALAVLVASDGVRAYAVALVGDGPAWGQVLRVMFGGDLAGVWWVLAAFAAVRLRQGRESGLIVAAFVGVAVAAFSGLSDVGYLLHSQVPAAMSPTLARATVVIAAGVGIGLLAAGVEQVRRADPAAAPAVSEGP